jgi:RNA polymerase sigma-70 factor, ECF subfamily
MDRTVDAEIAERLLERDEEALRQVMATHGPIVLAMARKVVAEPSLAEEVAQDTFVALWRRPGASDPLIGSLQGFLLGIARNKGIDLVRREEALRRTRDSLLAEAAAASRIESGTEQVEERQRVKAALEGLSSVQREAIVLAFFGGRTYREVARELDIPEGTAKTRLRDGLMRLKQLIGSGKESR